MSDESIRALSWQEKAQAVSLQIVEENYYLDLWERVKPHEAVKWADLTKAEALKPFEDFWELLPSSPAIRRRPFHAICELAEEFCFGPNGNTEAGVRVVEQTLANNPDAIKIIYTEGEK